MSGTMQPPEEVVEFEWSATGTTSDARQVEGFNKFNFLIPSVFAGVSLIFKNAHSPLGPFEALVDDAGAAISLVVATDTSVAVTSSAPSLALAGASWLQLVSGASETAGTKVSCSKQV